MKVSSRLPFSATRWLLPTFLVGLMALPVDAKPPKLRDIADSVASNPILTKFAAMVQASDLGTFLSSRGPFTVFAPTDSAFARLPPAMLDTLLRPENKVRLQDVLLFHVVNGKRLTAKDLLLLKTTLSCQGNPLTFRTSHSGTQFVMKAKITSGDIKCQNGIINEIDTVLMPPESALPPIAAPPPPPATTVPANQDAVTPSPSVPADTNAIPVAPVAPSADTNAPPVAPAAPPQ